MVEGEKLFDISVRWPKRLRSSETDILDIPVDIINNSVVLNQGPSVVPTAQGTGMAPASTVGTQANTTNPISARHRGCGSGTWCHRSAKTAIPTPQANSNSTAPRRSIASRASV